MLMPEVNARHALACLLCIISIQLVVHFREPLQTTLLHHPNSPFSNITSSSNDTYSSQERQQQPGTADPSSVHRLTIPLSLPELSLLDELAAEIVSKEGHRTFAETGYANIHGTAIHDNSSLVKRIRDQIDCWTHHGSWVRDDRELNDIDINIVKNDENIGKDHTLIVSSPSSSSSSSSSPLWIKTPWAARKHYGHRKVDTCDVRFMGGLNQLDQAGLGGFYMGEYDRAHGHGWIVREAVKYRWEPDESICGPAKKREAGEDKGADDEKGSGSSIEATTSNGEVSGLDGEQSRYRPFNLNQFCASLAERSILLAGDVTQYQLHDSILSAAIGAPFSCHGELYCLHDEPHEICPPAVTGDSTTAAKLQSPSPSSSVGESEDKITTTINTSFLKFARNDVLSVPQAMNPEDDEFPNMSTVEQAWASKELLKNYTIVLLNKGLHYQRDEVFLSELVFTMKHLWKFYSNTVILYRATHPNVNCTVLKEQREDEALAGPAVAEDGGGERVAGEKENGEESVGKLVSIVPETILQRPLSEVPKRFSERRGRHRMGADNQDGSGFMYRPTLADIQRQNRMAKVIVENAGGIFLDTENMFAMRPDGRIGDDGDCSRFCAPGPVDAYVDLVFNVLRIMNVQPAS
ncbi:hypothetical protein EDD11_006666 [Mortierella claussenii]|nr:hypothetical protein EDD11_006666 [Mortierella claussenii]